MSIAISVTFQAAEDVHFAAPFLLNTISLASLSRFSARSIVHTQSMMSRACRSPICRRAVSRNFASTRSSLQTSPNPSQRFVNRRPSFVKTSLTPMRGLETDPTQHYSDKTWTEKFDKELDKAMKKLTRVNGTPKRCSSTLCIS